MTRRDQWKKFIGHHRYALLTDECSIKAYKPELNMTSKPNLDITQCAKYILNNPLNFILNSPSYDFYKNIMVHPQPYQRIERIVNPKEFQPRSIIYLSSPA